MSQNYTPEFKKKIVRLHEEEGRTYKSITAKYGVSKASISKWCSEFSKECQTDPQAKEDYDSMKENLRLKRENEELRKEIAFLKSSGILCKGNRLEAYRFIDDHKEEFGVRWLLRRLAICPNAYYNYRKHRKADYYAQKKVQEQIRDIYHRHNGVDGYRSMAVYQRREGHSYSTTTIHKYMNTEMGLRSVVRPKKPGTKPGKPHKVFENRLKQDFTAERADCKWCTDFTYLFLKNGEVRYNCTIIDLHDRSVVASITDRHITSDLAIRTLQKALDSQRLSGLNTTIVVGTSVPYNYEKSRF